MKDTDKAPPFDHPRNITVGKARVIYAMPVTEDFAIKHPEGWVLPGGRRTQDYLEAYSMAVRMDKEMA